jgi:hypothetical protein
MPSMVYMARQVFGSSTMSLKLSPTAMQPDEVFALLGEEGLH